MRGQIIAVVLIAAATYGVVLRIAEAKVEASVGAGSFPLDDARYDERTAFQRLRASLDEIGERPFSERLERLRVDGALWIAPALGPERWAVFTEALGLVRRIYVRRLALLDPCAHLYASGPPGACDLAQRAFAWISLAGALRHELSHLDGMIEEEDAYAAEIAWYEGVRASSWFASLQGETHRVHDWALESAVANARRAAARADN